MHVKDEIRVGAVWIGDAGEGGGGSARDEGAGAGVAVSGEEDHLAGGAGSSYGRYGGLDGAGPAGKVRHWVCELA